MDLARTTRMTIVFLLAVVGTSFLLAAEAYAADHPNIGVEKGEIYPDFFLPTIDGEPGRLSDYRGKKIILFHFASW